MWKFALTALTLAGTFGAERATMRVNDVVGNAEEVAGETNDGARAACHAQTLP